MSTEGRQVLYQLETEVEAELRLVQSGDADAAAAVPQSEWMFEPSEIERYRISLRSLLAAVTGLERDRDIYEPPLT